jgi:hypothetical protein
MVVGTEATVVEGDGSVGVICRRTPQADGTVEWYEFMARDGLAAIQRAGDVIHGNILASTSDVSLPSGEPVTITGACVDDGSGAVQLAMAVNGELVLFVVESDHPLAGTVPGLLTRFPTGNAVVRWHEFSAHLPAG